MNGERWKLIGQGFNGWHAEADNCRGSGGLLDVDWHGRRVRGYVDEAAEGALVYDASGVEYGLFVTHVFRGPMVKTELAPDAVERFCDTPRAEGEYGPLDYVGLGIFERLLRALPGCRIGRVHSGAVVWEDEKES